MNLKYFLTLSMLAVLYTAVSSGVIAGTQSSTCIQSSDGMSDAQFEESHNSG